ncbi:MAG: IS21 family transposase [Planctomycetota bacterium]|jgi:transposase|nr:IS21 family transposase [Planctomycetota bacterium]
MHGQLTRHSVQVLLAAGHAQHEVARHAGVSARSVRRIAQEQAVVHVDDSAERQRRGVGRPSKAEPYRQFVLELLEKEPQLMSLEVLRRCRERGYEGGKSAMYALIAQIRPASADFQMRFEGVPGEFSQHDFGQVNIHFLDGTRRCVRFFASRLKWSRWAQVSLVDNEQTETLVRTLLDHFVAWDGVPLCCVFDRPKTVALKWKKDGSVTDWNPVFAYAAMEIGFTAEVCWPHSPRQKGAIENVVKWVKNSFFKQRRFLDMQDLQQQLDEWLEEVNCQRPSRATDTIPAQRLAEEKERLRPPKVQPDELALRIPISVGMTGYVIHETHPYSMPPEAAGLPGTLYLYRDRVRIIAGRHQAEHQRLRGRKEQSTLPEHRSAQLAAVSGKRGKRYLKRQHLFDTGEAAVQVITELVHRNPRGWIQDVDLLHDLLQRHGPDAMNRAFRAAVDVGRLDVRYVTQCLQSSFPEPLPLFSSEVLV